MLRGLIVDFGGVLTDPGEGGGDGRPLVDAVLTARRHGLRTALVSNADSLDVPDGLFDTVVISGEVGVAKPDRRIFQLAAERLGLEPAECVFVDDLAGYVLAAVQVGMVGVHHRDVATTLDELSVLFDVPFR
ncbi:MAG TPA: HAD-IA family hydrolase [Pseudonocardiaceae bacterium]|nr:HAD-IA family hydrolase [Pseudonocardiaceae bacterium]